MFLYRLMVILSSLRRTVPADAALAALVESCRERFLPTRAIYDKAEHSWETAVEKYPELFLVPYASLGLYSAHLSPLILRKYSTGICASRSHSSRSAAAAAAATPA